MTAITPAQQRTLDFIRAFIAEKGYPPTRNEIRTAFGYSSANSVESHLNYLVKSKAIELIPNIARGIKILEAV